MNGAASVAHAAAAAGVSAGMNGWLSTNDDRATAGTAGAAGTLSATTYGTISVAATDGTTRAVTASGLTRVITNAYKSGGRPQDLVMSLAMREIFSSFIFSAPSLVAQPVVDVGKVL
ncbi:MAG: DUF5309 domain-containing protein [Myxococcales bacterium]|nr:DUF5309 domain-containing protein [Myxococcales bacterium]